MRIDVVEPPVVRVEVIVADTPRIEVIHGRVEVTVIDMEA